MLEGAQIILDSIQESRSFVEEEAKTAATANKSLKANPEEAYENCTNSVTHD
jgi:hypothetical protein